MSTTTVSLDRDSASAQTSVEVTGTAATVELEMVTRPSSEVGLISAGPRGPQGVRGDKGEPGRDGLLNNSYTHRQTTLSTLWTVIHGFGYVPAGLHVVGSDGESHEPVVVTATEQAVVLSFLTPTAGHATVS